MLTEKIKVIVLTACITCSATILSNAQNPDLTNSEVFKSQPATVDAHIYRTGTIDTKNSGQFPTAISLDKDDNSSVEGGIKLTKDSKSGSVEGQSRSTGFNTQANSNSLFPASTFQNPLGAGQFGSIVFGGTIENKTRIANMPDANAAVYVGLGNPENFVGGGVTLNIYGLTNKYGEKNNMGQGSINLHLNKLFFHNRLLVDMGMDNVCLWGVSPKSKNYVTYQRSMYLSTNYVLYLKAENHQTSFSYLNITAGVGNGYFRRDNNLAKSVTGSFDPYLSLATPLFEGTNIIGEWNGYDIGTGIASIPFKKVPFMFTFEVTDLVFGNPRLVSSVSIPIIFKKPKTATSNSTHRTMGVKSFRTVRTI